MSLTIHTSTQNISNYQVLNAIQVSPACHHASTVLHRLSTDDASLRTTTKKGANRESDSRTLSMLCRDCARVGMISVGQGWIGIKS